MSAFLQDLRYGARTLLRNPGFAAVVIGVLALGIGANSVMFSVINAVLLRPLPFHEPNRLYEFSEVNPKGIPQGVSPADIVVFSQRGHVFEDLAVSRWQNLTLTGPEGPENVYGALVSSACFRMLGTRPAIGRIFRDDEFRPDAADVVILSDRLWRRRFARDPRVLGLQLMMSGRAYTVIGVMPPDFSFPQRRHELWTPWRFTADLAHNRELRYPSVIRLKLGITQQQAHAEAEAIFRSIAPEDARQGWRIRIIPLGYQAMTPIRSALMVLLASVGFVLLIACLNAANLLLARASDRGREIALRSALGAGRLRVVRQLLTESLLLAGLGCIAGVLLASWGGRALIALFPEATPVPRLEQTRMDASVFLFTLVVSLVAGLAFGLAPALHASRGNLSDALKEGAHSSGGLRSHRLRNLLVIAETALSFVLLIGAGLMLRSFDNLLRVRPGFNPERVLTVRIPLPPTLTERPRQVAYCERILDRVGSIPGLNALGLATVLPLGDVDANAPFVVEGRPVSVGERQLVKFRSVSAGYFRAMQIALLKGRVFGDSDTAGARGVVVISESLARRYFPDENPVGKRVGMSDDARNGPWLTVIGVVNDVKYGSLSGESSPEMYRDFRQLLSPPFSTTLVLRTTAENPMRLAAAVQREIRAVNPDQVVSDVQTMTQVVSNSVARPRFYTLLLSIFAAIALVLAGSGLYGLMSYSVSRRSHEIGIRMVLGASSRTIFRHVVGRGLMLAVIGVIAGVAGSFALTRLIAAQLFQVAPTDPLTFTCVSLLLLAVALAASYVPARRAVQVDPIIALRSE